jgi:hypothetical protein
MALLEAPDLALIVIVSVSWQFKLIWACGISAALRLHPLDEAQKRETDGRGELDYGWWRILNMNPSWIESSSYGPGVSVPPQRDGPLGQITIWRRVRATSKYYQSRACGNTRRRLRPDCQDNDVVICTCPLLHLLGCARRDQGNEHRRMVVKSLEMKITKESMCRGIPLKPGRELKRCGTGARNAHTSKGSSRSGTQRLLEWGHTRTSTSRVKVSSCTTI